MSLLINKAYMIRNDGKQCDSGEVHVYLSDPSSLDIEYEDIYSWVNSPTNKRALTFLYNNTQYDNVKAEVKALFELRKSEELLYEYCKNSYYNLNQEFLRARFGGEYFYQNTKDIYFRISSQRFNWFDIIWQFVFEHQSEIDYITVEHDSNTFQDNRNYRLGKTELTHLDIQAFLTLPGNPVLENLDKKLEINVFLNNLRLGKSISESAKGLPSYRARKLYESTFTPDLIEYDLNHCLRKEK